MKKISQSLIVSSNENSRLKDVRNHRKQKNKLSEPVVSAAEAGQL